MNTFEPEMKHRCIAYISYYSRDFKNPGVPIRGAPCYKLFNLSSYMKRGEDQSEGKKALLTKEIAKEKTTK